MMMAQILLGFGLMLAHPTGRYSFEVAYKRVFVTEAECQARRDELLAQPEYAGAFAIIDCIRTRARPEDFEEGTGT